MKNRFNISDKVLLAYPPEFYELLDTVWAQIPENEREVIWENLVRIGGVNYGYFSKEQRQKQNMTENEGGITTLDENTGLCIVRIDGSRSHNVIKISIAHELAHVFYNHPKKQTEKPIAEEEAKAKAREWGFVLSSESER
jgi:hypothetical protein